MICSLSLDSGVSTYYRDSQYEISYGRVGLSSLLYQDASMRMTTSVEGAIDGAKRFQKLMESRLLEVNTSKSVYLISGRKKTVSRIREEIRCNPICYNGNPLKEKTSEKWLGDVIHVSGNKASTLASINERKIRIYNAINEVISIIEDSRINKLGSGSFARKVWELAIVPALINNSDCWEVHNKEVQKELEKFQTAYFRGVLALPKSVPKPSICYEVNLLEMKYRMYSRLLNFMKHVHSSDSSSLCKQVLDEQITNDLPGLAKVAKEIEEEIGISGVFDENVNKLGFKKTVKEACKYANDESIANSISKYKKMSAIRDEMTKGNDYFCRESLTNVRTLFRFRVDLFEAKKNFKNKKEYKDENYLCDSCESEVDENTHVLYCVAYKDLREGKSMNNDEELCQYLQKVLEIRARLRLNR